MGSQVWSLGTATGVVNRERDNLVVDLCGVLTAAAYEALHLRLARSRCRRKTILFADGVLLVATAKSLAEAAVRGTPVRQIGPEHAIMLRVRRWRFAWACDHCAFLMADGLIRVLTEEPAAASA